jgi:hypothetical protein
MPFTDAVTSPYPVAWTNPVNMRASAALPAAGAWDATPTEQNIFGAQGLTLSFTYTRGAAGGAFDYQIELSPYAVAANAPAGANEWVTESIYGAGAVALGADTQSREQREYQTYGSQGAAAEDFQVDLELQAPYERIRILARESADGVQGTPGTLQVTMNVW